MCEANLFHDLNSQQRAALEHLKGPMLVLAGAGSGKTKLITHKYAYIYKQKANKKETIFAATFTNKAAHEMKERITNLLSEDLHHAWIGTFHSHCNRILRREIHALGFGNDFVIYDADDQCKLIRHILNDMKLYEALFKGVATKISLFKASLISPEKLLSDNTNFNFDEKLIKVYMRYQDEMQRSNALDFDDLIMCTVKLFQQQPDLLKKYQQLFSYVLVDEFQDINYGQYHLIRLLSGPDHDICVVGDDDQSIYKFRGANIDTILSRFEKDFPQAKVIKLEQTYRSTQNILDVSHGIISKISFRRSKRLWTDRGFGEKVCYYWFMSENEEAHYIAKTIKDFYLKGICSYDDIAILYRVNLQSRVLEYALKSERIPYKVIGDISFYQKTEIKYIISYLRLIINKDDNVSLRRIINIPPRGIGMATIKKIEYEAMKEGISLYKAIQKMTNAKGFSSSIKEKLSKFLALIDDLPKSKAERVSEAIRHIDNLTGYTETLDEAKIENISELMASNGDNSLNDFLDTVSLTTNADDSISMDTVSLMTLHNTKGLEFSIVFITGLEDGLLPYFKATESSDELDEERRLFYVGMTRAKDTLFVTGARRRRLYSKYQEQEPSRFLNDIPKECCMWFEKKHSPSCTLSKTQIGKSATKIFPYNTGCRVKHPKWGVGVIRDCYGEENDIKVMVNFPNVGIKRLALKYANLERL